MESFFDRALVAARRLGASDVHLKPGLAPILRIGGELRTLSDVPPLSREFLQSLGHSLLNDRRREQLERTGEVVLATATSNGGRQRVHVFHHRAGLGLSLRLVPPEPPTLETLGLPPEVRGLTEPGGGLVVIAGGASSGRTTTVAALLDDLVGQRPVRLVTIEDPVEFLLKDRRGVVVQREVGTDVPTVGAALRAAARQDLDVLAVSDVADPDAAALAVDAARAGRLVLATMMATDVRDAARQVGRADRPGGWSGGPDAARRRPARGPAPATGRRGRRAQAQRGRGALAGDARGAGLVGGAGQRGPAPGRGPVRARATDGRPQQTRPRIDGDG